MLLRHEILIKSTLSNKTKGQCQENYDKQHFSHYFRPGRRREIIPLDKWEILPEQIEYKEELGRGAFGVVYKAILKKRQGIEVFDSREVVESKESNQVVAVKKLQGTGFAMIFVVDYEGVWVLWKQIEISSCYKGIVKTEKELKGSETICKRIVNISCRQLNPRLHLGQFNSLESIKSLSKAV